MQRMMATRESGTTVYEFPVQGELDTGWYDWFDQFEVSASDGVTTLCGPVPDQAALYGVILRLRDTGPTLLSANRLGTDVG
jgi:hypothetical protein